MIHDVVIIGAGPCGLAVAARLREYTPSALFTDAEHARYWRRHTKTQTLEKESKTARRRARKQVAGNTVDAADDTGLTAEAMPTEPLSILVLDSSSNEWLTTWHSRFEALKISHLRSPLFFHCDPRDRDGLLEYSHAQGRSDELEEINNVVGREVSKHQKKKKGRTKKRNQCTRHLHLDNRDQIDYYTPSAALFREYCEYLVDRYGLANVIQRATVTSINHGPPEIPTEGEDLFTLTTSTDQLFLARSVVVAVGSGTQPSIPASLRFLHQGSADHIFSAQSLLPHSIDQQRARTLSIAVVGGGLTSAQVVLLLLQQHKVDKVYLVIRSKLKVKHFDVDLEWVSKLRNANMAAFWSADTDEDRFEMLKDARNGGSMPPNWAKAMRRFEKQGRLECLENTSLVDGSWNNEAKHWDLLIKSDCQPRSNFNSSVSSIDNESTCLRKLEHVDHVICATGFAPNIDNVSFLDDMRIKYPVQSIRGLAQLSDDLKWNSEIPLFVTGALAGLRLGPGAGNLAGARLGAERVAWGIENSLHRDKKGARTSAMSRRSSAADSAYWSATSSDKDDQSPGSKHLMTDRSEFTGGFSNQFNALAE